MKGFLTIFVLIPLLVCLFFLYLSNTAKAPRLGVMDHKLKPCPSDSNCMVSEQGFATDILPLDGSSERTWLALPSIIEADGGKLIKSDFGYIYATYTSSVFGFVDDVEFRLDQADEVIHMRSASRSGTSDLGVNRRRLERIRTKF